MPSEISLEIAAGVYALYLRETGDTIVAKSLMTSDSIIQLHGSNKVLSVAMELCAYFVHEFSRRLPNVEGDYFNDFAYSPMVHHCSEQMGCLVEHLQDVGAISPPVFSGDAIEAETRRTLETRDEEYCRLSRAENVTQHVSKIIINLVDKHRDAAALITTEWLITKQLVELDFTFVSQHLQRGLTPDLLSYLRKMS